jgi:hypothetical protein
MKAREEVRLPLLRLGAREVLPDYGSDEIAHGDSSPGVLGKLQSEFFELSAQLWTWPKLDSRITGRHERSLPNSIRLLLQ